MSAFLVNSHGENDIQPVTRVLCDKSGHTFLYLDPRDIAHLGSGSVQSLLRIFSGFAHLTHPNYHFRQSSGAVYRITSTLAQGAQNWSHIMDTHKHIHGLETLQVTGEYVYTALP